MNIIKLYFINKISRLKNQQKGFAESQILFVID